MEPTYIHAESTVRPQTIEVGITTVYLRRNIVEMQKTDLEGKPPMTVFTYEEAQLTKDEALFILAENQIILSKAINDADGMSIDQEFRLTMLELKG